jgi:hypothetical protein
MFAFLVLGHGRRQLLWFAVTRHPTAEWLVQQIVEAFPWGTVPISCGMRVSCVDRGYKHRCALMLGARREHQVPLGSNFFNIGCLRDLPNLVGP